MARRSTLSSRAWLGLGVATLVGVAGLALAQTSRPVLHEDLPDDHAPAPSPLLGASPSGGNPAAISAGNKVLPQPAADQAPAGGEPVLGGGGFAADRSTETRPDYNTGADATLHYVSVFNPDVVPFKRMSALDGVADDYTLNVEHRALTEVAVGGTTDRGRDRFWGSVLVKLSPGTDVALPSVAPDMRILSFEVTPRLAVRFSRDGADNFYVRSDEASAAGTYRLVFLVDADAGYFAPSLPNQRHYTPRAVAALAPPELRPHLPDAVRRAAQRTLDNLAVDGDMDLGVAFNKLVAYFRGFQAKTAPPATGDVYRDLCDSQAGVCRHRSFAFMITANALGLPTRFVANEAHAFVEVWFPERGWQRIDLGGAALRLEVTGAENKTMHRPRAEDPFAKPKAYSENYTQLAGDIRGLTDQQLADKHRPLDQAPASGDFSSTPGGAAGPGGGRGSGSGGADRGADRGADPGADKITPDPNLPAVTQDPKKPIPRLQITTADTSAYRGDALHVEGRVDVAGVPLADHPVDIYLAPAGQRGANPISLGRAMTSPDGTFRLELTVPSSVTLASYELYLASPEDARFNAALSD
jgi:hypothetical protein